MRIPAAPPEQPGARIHDLSFTERWAYLVVDLGPGERTRLTARSPYFFLVLEGRELTLTTAGDGPATLRLRKEGFGQCPGGELHIANGARDGAARLLLIHSLLPGSERLVVPALARHVTEIELEKRPGSIRLWSLLRHTDLARAGWQLGIELVDIDYRVTRHRHQRSAARVLVLEGTGHCGLHEDQLRAIQAGDVLDFPEDISHGFDPAGGLFRIISLQEPPIDNDYVLEEDKDYDYAVLA